MTGWSASLTRLRHAQSGRRLIAGVAGLSVVIAVLGILALIAQSAIPGETLYALKRGTEQARLVLAGSGQAEGRVLLGFASTRLDELDQLLNQPVALSATGSGIQAADGEAAAELLVATMETMDRQTTEGTNALTTSAVDERSLPTLQFVGEWGIDQFGVLAELTERMPQEARDRAENSKNLLQRVVQRLELLAQAIGCDCSEDLSNSDDLGPMPCPSCSDSSDNGSPSASGPTNSGGGSGSAPSSSSSPVTSAAPGTSSAPTAPGSSTPPGSEPTATSTPAPDQPPLPLPIPIPIPTQSTSPGEPPPPPAPPPSEGEPCVLIGFLGIEIPGIIIGGVCIGLGG